jgi:outer membrane receptor protein involved in Fe transport
LATVLALTGNATAQEATVSQDAGGATELSAIVIDGATKIPTALIETPRTVSLISRDELDKRGVQDIIEAVRYSAGVSTGATVSIRVSTRSFFAAMTSRPRAITATASGSPISATACSATSPMPSSRSKSSRVPSPYSTEQALRAAS